MKKLKQIARRTALYLLIAALLSVLSGASAPRAAETSVGTNNATLADGSALVADRFTSLFYDNGRGDLIGSAVTLCIATRYARRRRLI